MDSMRQASVVPFGVDMMRVLSSDEVAFATSATASASPTSTGGTVLDRDD